MHAADPTTQDLLALLLRRADPSVLHIVLGFGTGPLEPDLATAITTYTGECAHRRPLHSAPTAGRARNSPTRTSSPTGPATTPQHGAPTKRHRPLAERDCMTTGPPSLSPTPTGGYASARSHTTESTEATRREPAGARCAKHWSAASAVGYSAATVDFGMRGREVSDPVEHQLDYSHFTAKAANALIPIGRIAESLELYRELRRRYAIPQVHMTCAYAIAVLHTRFFTPPDTTTKRWSGRTAAGLWPAPNRTQSSEPTSRSSPTTGSR